jgi:hypothetical protein
MRCEKMKDAKVIKIESKAEEREEKKGNAEVETEASVKPAHCACKVVTKSMLSLIEQTQITKRTQRRKEIKSQS